VIGVHAFCFIDGANGIIAAFRCVEAHGGTRLVAIGRREVVDLYLRSGLEPVGITVQSGAVTYDFLQATTEALRQRLRSFGGLIDRLETNTAWQLNFPFRKPVACFHGGQFFAAIGSRFDDLARSDKIINADVLDAWFPPSPKVLAEIQNHLPWLLRTSDFGFRRWLHSGRELTQFVNTELLLDLAHLLNTLLKSFVA
jgi:hypothetical protein